MLKINMNYRPLAQIQIDFGNVYYGAVKEDIAAIADETVSRATVRNAGNVPARVALWQDDMGLGKTGDAYNIKYGARLSDIGAEWADYGPFETVAMPGILVPGQAADMDFLVKVLNFPPAAEGAAKIDYQGKMTIDAVAAVDAAGVCAVSFLNEAAPIAAASDAGESENDIDIKPEIESAGATTTPPL
jgi:hypothetical protein